MENTKPVHPRLSTTMKLKSTLGIKANFNLLKKAEIKLTKHKLISNQIYGYSLRKTFNENKNS